jgi:WhiB family transcriptional regulator, redox-sensing transcriptional regulator
MTHEWMDKAACVDVDIHHDAWHPNTANYLADTYEALRLCNDCPVVDECLNYALDENLEYGIYGGMTQEERRAMRKRRQRAGKLQVRKVDGAWTVSDGKHQAQTGSVEAAWDFVKRLVA